MSVRDLRAHAGRFAVVGFSGASVPADLARLVRTFDVGGVIYFAHNVVDPRQVADLSREVASLKRDWPLWIGVDQEGGRVARLKAPFTEWPPAAVIGRAASAELAARQGRALAAELAAVGINWDFAPVLDVWTNPANAVIGDRAFSSDPARVAELGASFIGALQEAGVAACGKHFPGHGDTAADSHEALPVVEHDLGRLEAVELLPFRRAIDAGVASLMTAHVMAPAWDETRVASFSHAIVDRLLKGRLGFGGLVVSDDLGMKAVSTSAPLGECAVQAIGAGCDVVLMCRSTADEQMAAIEDLIRAAESGRIGPARIDDALGRQRRMKERFFGGRHGFLGDEALALVGCDAHQAVAREMAAWQ